MVSFSCEACGDILVKKKLDSHKNQCFGASFTCLDCMVNFPKLEYRTHTSCISEAQKYQGALYRPEKEKKQKPSVTKSPALATTNLNDMNKKTNQNEIPGAFPNNMESAPKTPNVFDFLVNTPDASCPSLHLPEPMQISDDTPGALQKPNGCDFSKSLVRTIAQDHSDPISGQKIADQSPASAQKREKRREKKIRDAESSDKKRKRLHVETKASSPQDIDETMTDAPPPVPHSGLTGGLVNLMSRSSHNSHVHENSSAKIGSNREVSPGSPVKKSKHATSRGNMVTMTNSRSLVTQRPPRQHTEDWAKRRLPKHRSAPDHVKTKLIGFKPPDSGTPSANHDMKQIVMYKTPAARPDLLLGLIKKGPESERGISLNKALKQYHRERQTTSLGICKAAEEKELWRSLRMKRNVDGEVVIFLG